MVEFGRTVVNQLGHLDSGGKKRINWDFFQRDDRLQEGYRQLSKIKTGEPLIWKRIEKEFLRYKTTAKVSQGNIFWVEALTDNAQPDTPMFDLIEINYPLTPMHLNPSLYTFLNSGLREKGKYRITNDMERINFLYFANMGGSVTKFGRIDRPKGIKDPTSVYDLAFGEKGYFYVEGEKRGSLPTPGSFSLQTRLAPFGLPWVAYQFIRYVTSGKRSNPAPYFTV